LRLSLARELHSTAGLFREPPVEPSAGLGGRGVV
jgi:hypothetical protein